MTCWVRGAALAGILLAAAACAHRVGGRDKGFQDAINTAEALAEPLEPRRRAIVIGVDHYEDPAFPPLRFAGADATAFGDVLRSADGSFDEVEVLVDAHRDDVLRALRRAREELRPEDVLLVYFSGHGTRIADGEASRRFLLLGDSRSADVGGTALELEALQRFFADLPADRKILVVDACFSGDGKSVVRPVAVPDDTAPLVARATEMGAGEAHLFATSPGRPSREDDSLKHGVYTYFLLEALTWGLEDADLDHDRVITAYEAHDYARGRVLAHTAGVQVPEAAFRVVGEADVVLTGEPDERVRRDRSLVYLYPSEGSDLHGAELVVDGRNRGALPGTHPVPRGRHHLVVRDAEGRVLVDGTVRLDGDRGYSVDELRRLARGPRHHVGLRATGVAVPALRDSIGPGALGVELWGAWRAGRAPHSGLYAEGAIGVGVSPTRPGIEAGRAEQRRLGWVAVGVGSQRDVGLLRIRVGGGVSGFVLPPDYVGDPPEQPGIDVRPQELGWSVLAIGPSGSIGWVARPGWTVGMAVRPHFAVLDVEGNGRLRWIPWLSGGIGGEVDW